MARKVKKIVVGNWKMNPTTLSEAQKIISSVKRGAKNMTKTQVVICPPTVFAGKFGSFPSGQFFLGAQNVFYETLGSYTGETSAPELSEMKISHVILGHSERRKMGETDEVVNRKVKAAVTAGLSAIICVGELERDQHGDYLEFIKNQVTMAMREVNNKFLNKIIIAYEPVWLIGAKEAMSPQDVQETTLYIKKILRELYGPLGDDVRVIYGASVAPESAKDIMHGGFVDGLLVGRDSLDPKKFVEIIRVVN